MKIKRLNGSGSHMVSVILEQCCAVKDMSENTKQEDKKIRKNHLFQF